MLSPNSDLIAVSLAYPKDLKSPYRMGPPRVSSVRNLLEKVLRLQRHYSSGPIKLGIFDIYRFTLYAVKFVSDYHPLFMGFLIFYFFKLFLFWMQLQRRSRQFSKSFGERPSYFFKTSEIRFDSWSYFLSNSTFQN